MRAALLHLDDALMPQRRLRQAVCNAGGRLLDYRDLGPALRLWARPAALARLKDRLTAALPAGLGPMLVFSGSGDFHHVTLLLLQRALEAAGQPKVTLLHFDNHPDWVKFGPGAHCGSWASQAARLANVDKVITVGVCSGDLDRPQAADVRVIEQGRHQLYAYRAPNGGDLVRMCGQAWPTIEAMGEAAFADFLPGLIETDALYVTVDKDVLRAEDAGTNWDQGRTSLSLLKTLIARAAEGRRLIGADIVGDWSKPVYGGTPLAWLLKQGEAMLDQPWRAPGDTACAANEDVNLALLSVLQSHGA